MRLSRVVFVAAPALMLLAGPFAAVASASAGGSTATAPSVQAVCQQQSFLEGEHYSAVQIAQLSKNAGFTGQDWTISVAVALAESAGWTRARLINTDCSVDRGLWQINGYWHSEVSDSCAFTPSCAAGATRTIWSNRGWTEWTTYNNGAYQSHMAEAQAAVNQVGGGGGGNPPPTGGTWRPNTAYTAGQQVSYGGRNYRCLQSHTSLTGWEPPNVPALWSPA